MDPPKNLLKLNNHQQKKTSNLEVRLAINIILEEENKSKSLENLKNRMMVSNIKKARRYETRNLKRKISFLNELL